MRAEMEGKIYNILILSIVPSPYQRDLFAAMNTHPCLNISVSYAQANLSDSPFPERSLAPYENIHHGIALQWKNYKFILNWKMPSLDGFDVVVVNGYYTTLAQWALRHVSGKLPVILWAEKMIGSKEGLRGFLFKQLTKPLAGVDAIVAIGKKAMRDYEDRYPEIPVYELPYICAIDSFQATQQNRPRKPVRILFCGQMIHRKGVDILLRAFSLLLKRGLAVELILVGWEAELKGMLAEIEPSVVRHIDYRGFQSVENLPVIFAEADIFVLPSRYDGWGVVVNQAVGAGLPIVCSDAVGAADDLVYPGLNGHVFEAGNIDQLAVILGDLASSPDKIKDFSRHSIKLAKGLTPDRGASRWYEIISNVHTNTKIP